MREVENSGDLGDLAGWRVILRGSVGRGYLARSAAPAPAEKGTGTSKTRSQSPYPLPLDLLTHPLRGSERRRFAQNPDPPPQPSPTRGEGDRADGRLFFLRAPKWSIRQVLDLHLPYKDLPNSGDEQESLRSFLAGQAVKPALRPCFRTTPVVFPQVLAHPLSRGSGPAPREEGLAEESVGKRRKSPSCSHHPEKAREHALGSHHRHC